MINSLLTKIVDNECIHGVMITDNNRRNDAVLWCEENLSTIKIEVGYREYNSFVPFVMKYLDDIDGTRAWSYSGRMHVWFENEIDAMAFKLRWL